MRSNDSSEANIASSSDHSNIWERVGEKQEEWLLPLKEDLAAWLNKTLGILVLFFLNLIHQLHVVYDLAYSDI